MEYSWRNITLLAVVTGLSIDAVLYIYGMYLEKTKAKKQVNQLNEEENKVFFFPDSSISTPLMGTNVKEETKGVESIITEKKKGPTFQLSKYMQSAKKSLDICVFVITSTFLTNEVINISKRGVTVRVITDDEQSQDCFGSQIEHFRAAGIKVRCKNKSAFLMHHKFVIIDGRLLVNGSFNWTRTAISGNNENLLSINLPSIVSPYVQEFEKLWNQFDPTT